MGGRTARESLCGRSWPRHRWLRLSASPNGFDYPIGQISTDNWNSLTSMLRAYDRRRTTKFRNRLDRHYLFHFLVVQAVTCRTNTELIRTS